MLLVTDLVTNSNPSFPKQLGVITLVSNQTFPKVISILFQARFQAKQLEEKEEKMIQMLEDKQVNMDENKSCCLSLMGCKVYNPFKSHS